MSGCVMVDDTLRKIEARLRDSKAVRDETREELLDLLTRLRTEIHSLSQTDAARANDIARMTAISTEEATSERQNRESVQSAIDELSRAVDDFETSHPRLVQVVNRIATTLANLGI